MSDYISRADAIEAVRKELVCDGRHDTHDKVCRFIADVLLPALPSAEAVHLTCKTCADRAMCIMSAPDGNWKACKDYRPSADAEPTQGEKCEDCIHNGTNKDKITCKECASAEVVQGEWIDIDNYYRMATCSHCHKVTMFEKWGEYTKPYHFCPNCGARMTPYKGGDNE